nr:hypothetical protein Cry52Nrm2_p082 [Cryptomonas curvata]
MLNLKNKKISIHLQWAFLLINVYVFLMYTPILTYSNNYVLYNQKKKLYSDGTTLFCLSSIQIQIFRQFLESFILFFSKKGNRYLGFKKRLNYSVVLTRIFCFLVLSKKLYSVNIWNSMKLSNFLKNIQLMIGLEFGLYILYLFEISFILPVFKLLVTFVCFLYTISFVFKIQKLTYKIPILLLIPENCYDFKFKKFLKKFFFFNLTLKLIFFIFYFFKLTIVKLFHEKNKFIKNLIQKSGISNFFFTLGIIVVFLKHLSIGFILLV